MHRDTATKHTAPVKHGKEPVKVGKRRILTEQERQAIVADRLMNLDNETIARKFNVTPVHVSRLFGAFRRTHPDAAVNEGLSGYRERLKRKSVVAVERALDDGTDPYKSAGVGVATLKGIGEWQGDQLSVGGVQVTISIPATLAIPESLTVNLEPERTPMLPEGDRAEEPEE
jgi:hypothetical protein